MKKIILITLAMFCTIFAGCRPNSGNKFYNTTPTSFRYQYSGMMAHPIFSYEVETKEDGKLTLAYSTGGPDITIIKAPDNLLQTIGEIVRNNKIYKIKSHYMPDMEILDGYGWSMSIEYADGYISSGGSNAGPGGDISAGISLILKSLKEVVDNATPEDIIGTDSFFNRR